MIVKPFTMAHVLRATSKHMRRSVDVSIRKTSERWKEFATDSAKSQEVMMTLMVLHDMRNMLDRYQREHADKFRDKHDGVDTEARSSSDESARTDQAQSDQAG